MPHNPSCFCASCRGDAVILDKGICTHTILCPNCGTNHGNCNTIKPPLFNNAECTLENPCHIKECPMCYPDMQGEKMLPDPNEVQQTSTRRSKNSGSGITTLKPEHLSTTPKGAKVLGVQYDAQGSFGASVNLKIAMDGHTFIWYVNVQKNPNYKSLVQKLGRDENDWVEKNILLAVVENFSGKLNIEVSFPESRKSR